MGSEAQHRPVPVVDADLDNLYYADEPEEPPLPRKRVPSGDVYEATRAGDIERLKILLEQGVNVNARDAWDSVALYYACLAGHLDAARMLLESGAICSEHTFDGDRCHYAALNLRVRKLLKAFEARPPPLEPLPKSLRELFLSSKANSRFLEGSTKSNLEEIGNGAPDGVIGRIQNGKMQANAFTHSVAVFNNDFTPDITFYVGGWPIEAHRAILVARSPFFKKKFEKEWKQRKEIRLSNRKLTYPALFSLVHFFYTDRLDVAVDDMEDLARICKVCGCRSLQKAIEKELVHQKYAEYKHMRDADDSQKRFILQGSSLPEEERLSSCLHGLLSLALARSKRDISVKETDNDLEGVHGIRKGAKEDLGFDGKDAYLPNSWKAEVTVHSRQNSVGVAENSEERAGWSKLVSGQNTEVMDLQSQVRNTHTLEASLDALSMSDKDVLEEDHADVYFAVEGKVYRSHQVILAARSEYFRTRFSRMNGFREGNPSAIETNSDALPILEEQDLSAEAFEKVLEYMYTDQIKQVDPEQAEEIFDAASRYLLFPLKRAVADALLPQLETSTPVELCHWLLLADMYGVWKLREHCLDAMAVNFEVFSATPEFRRMLCKLPPPSGDSSQRTSAPRAPGGEGKENQSNLLDDLREKWLEAEGEELDQRDESACQFDKRLELLVLAAENDEFEDNDSFLSKTYPDGARYITDE